jgi:hypothetical protein
LRQGTDIHHDHSFDVGAMATEQRLKTVAAHVQEAISEASHTNIPTMRKVANQAIHRHNGGEAS